MSTPLVEAIEHDGVLFAIILRRDFRLPGTHFFSPPELSQQLGYMRLPQGQQIAPHVHNPVPRQVVYTQEVLIIREGRLRVDFYDEERRYLESRELAPWDVVMLIRGGHGFEVLEDLEMLEVKQGPYLGDDDKTRFEAPDPRLPRVGP
jgi:mannose-6-phosphate isomerase-like protein (cupin superfamily)